MSQTGSTTRTVGSLGSSTDSGGGTYPTSKKDVRNNQRKIVRILTVVAYMMSVSTVALVLSAYYLFIWKPSTTEQIGRKVTDNIPYYPPSYSSSRQPPSSLLHYNMGTTNSFVIKGRKTKIPFLPTPQSLVVDVIRDEEDGEGEGTASYGNEDQDVIVDDTKSTSTPLRAPASSPEMGGVRKTTPHLLKMIITPTRSPQGHPVPP